MLDFPREFSGDFLPVAGNVMIRALLDEVNLEQVQCGTGDVNTDGNVDVLMLFK